MAKIDKIYDILRKTRNKAADETLTLALDHTGGPFSEAIVDTILQRSDTTAVTHLISKFHNLSAKERALVLSQSKSIFIALRKASNLKEAQPRLNCLEIIASNNMQRLAEIVIKLMRDESSTISDRANQILIMMANFASAHRDDPTYQDMQYFITALQNAVNSFDIHHQKQVIRAAMFVVPADRYNFWYERLQDYNPVGRAVRYYLLNYPDLQMANFCLTALKVASLKGTASRAIAWQENPDFVLELARNYHHKRGDAALETALKDIKKATWLEENKIALDKLSQAEQKMFLDFINAMDIKAEVRRQYFLLYRDKLTGDIAHTIYGLLINDNADDIEALQYFLVGSEPVLACKALRCLVALQPGNLADIVAGQLRSDNEQLRQIANDYFAGIAFDSWWENFEKMDAAKLSAAGKAIAKIDKELHNRLRFKLRDNQAWVRLKALLAVRALEFVPEHLADIQRLAKDKNEKVRSCAVGSLGYLGKTIDGFSLRCLLEALRDADKRVCANAIEALARCQIAQIDKVVQFFINDTNQRVRNNARRAGNIGLAKGVDILETQLLQQRRQAIARGSELLRQSIAQGLEQEANDVVKL